jgi:hypothetical protein
MKRHLLQFLVVTLLIGGGICATAQAQSPNYAHRNYAAAPAVVVYGGGNVGYGNGYGGGYGYNGYGNNYGGYGAGYGGGYGFAPIAPPRTAPYGAGYVGGYQPYQEMYLQRLYYGLGF